MPLPQCQPWLQRRRVSRRGLLTAALRFGIGAAGVALVGCGENEGELAAPERERRTQAPLAQQSQEQQPDIFGGHSRAAALAQAEQTVAQEVAAAQDAPLTSAATVDPVEWRERYHWRHLSELPGQASGPRAGGILRVDSQAMQTWDPFAIDPPTGDPDDAGHLLPLVYSQLVVADVGDRTHAHHTQVGGNLASAWEWADARTLIFTLRDDVAWTEHAPMNGRRLAARDVQACLDAFRQSTMRQADAYDAVQRVDPHDADHTVSLHLTQPAAYLLNKMTSPWQVIVPSELVVDPDLIDWSQQTRGTGPFKLALSTVNREWKLKRNDAYFKHDANSGTRLPYLDAVHGVNFDFVEAVIAAGGGESVAALGTRPSNWEMGELHSIRLFEASDAQAAIDAVPTAVLQVTPPSPGGGTYYTFQALSDSQFRDARVRQALSMALDRSAIAQEVYSGFAAADCAQNWAFVTDGSTAWGTREWPWEVDDLGPHFGHDPESVRGLLAAAGYAESTPLAVKIDVPAATLPTGAPAPPDSTIARLSAQVLGHLRLSLGGQVEIEPRERPWVQRTDAAGRTWLEPQPHPEADLIYGTSGPVYDADPDDLAHACMHSSGRLNRAGINDPEIDEWSTLQRQAVDQAARSELLERIRRKESERMWRMFTVNPYGVQARRGDVFNLVRTYFAKSLQLAPAQLERTWIMA